MFNFKKFINENVTSDDIVYARLGIDSIHDGEKETKDWFRNISTKLDSCKNIVSKYKTGDFNNQYAVYNLNNAITDIQSTIKDWNIKDHLNAYELMFAATEISTFEERTKDFDMGKEFNDIVLFLKIVLATLKKMWEFQDKKNHDKLLHNPPKDNNFIRTYERGSKILDSYSELF